MKISLKLKKSIVLTINDTMCEHTNMVEQLFRDGKLPHELWTEIHSSLLDAQYKMEKSVIHKIEMYSK